MSMNKTGELLLKKLTKKELNQLVESWDSGELDDVFDEILIPQDARNFPGQYVKLSNKL